MIYQKCKTIALSFLFVYLFLFFTNCKVQHRILFTPREKKLEQKFFKSLAIEKMKDFRTDEEEDKNNYSDGFIIIPLLFWKTYEFKKDTFNSYFLYSQRVETDLSFGLKKEFLSYNFFKEVYLSNESNWKEADYLIKSKIINTKIERSLTLYGLSIFGVLLYLSGLPYSYDKIQLEFEFELIEVKSNKTLLIKKYPNYFSNFENIYFHSSLNKTKAILEKQFETFAKDCIEVLDKKKIKANYEEILPVQLRSF